MVLDLGQCVLMLWRDGAGHASQTAVGTGGVGLEAVLGAEVDGKGFPRRPHRTSRQTGLVYTCATWRISYWVGNYGQVGCRQKCGAVSKPDAILSVDALSQWRGMTPAC